MRRGKNRERDECSRTKLKSLSATLSRSIHFFLLSFTSTNEFVYAGRSTIFVNISDLFLFFHWAMNPLDLQQQLADQRRGRYVRVSDVDRRLLIDTYKKGEDFIALAKKLNIKRSTGKRREIFLLTDVASTDVCFVQHEVFCERTSTKDAFRLNNVQELVCVSSLRRKPKWSEKWNDAIRWSPSDRFKCVFNAPRIACWAKLRFLAF